MLSRAGPAAACLPLFSGYLRATFDIIREREEAVAKRRSGRRKKGGIRDDLSFWLFSSFRKHKNGRRRPVEE